MYAGYGRMRRAPRSSIGFSLDEVINVVDLQEKIRRYTVKGVGEKACWMWHGPVQHYRSRNGAWGSRARVHLTLEKGYLSVAPAKMIYVLENGVIEDRRRVGHTCGESLCVRPEHIVLLKQSKRYWAKVKPLQRQQERHEEERLRRERSVAGVDADVVDQIRFYSWLGEDAKALGKHFGLDRRVVERILQAQTGPASAPVLLQAKG